MKAAREAGATDQALVEIAKVAAAMRAGAAFTRATHLFKGDPAKRANCRRCHPGAVATSIKRDAMRLSSALLVVALCLSSAVAHAADILGTLRSRGHFTTLLKALDAAGMAKLLATPGPFTVFAPSDAAFAALPGGTLDRLLKPENQPELKMVLGYHLTAGRLTTQELSSPVSAVKMSSGLTVTLKKQGDAVTVNDAHVTEPNIATDNGVVQGVDQVLLPPTVVQPRT